MNLENTEMKASEPMAIIHPVASVAAITLGQSFERWLHPPYFRPLVAAFPVAIGRVSGPANDLAAAAHGLPDGAARPEAVAVRLRRLGVRLVVGESEPVSDAALIRNSRARGASSLDLIRADPSLLPELQIGSWFHASARTRALRRALHRLPLLTGALRSPALLALGCDLAFWDGVRSAATAREWRRLTASSYVCLYYHRIAGEMKPGQERLDLSPEAFARQMRILRLLRFQPLAPDELLSFHSDPTATLPRRRYVVTADDGFEDAAAALRRHLAHRPQLFVSTAEVGKSATWAGGEPLAGWDELRSLNEGGAAVGSHGNTHAPFTELDGRSLADELAGSLRELRSRLGRPVPFLAYPHGRHNAAVVDAAPRAGYCLAYTTRPGRNGAGTHPYCLRRVGIKAWDSAPSFLWKLVTGEHVPLGWERRRQRGHDLADQSE